MNINYDIFGTLEFWLAIIFSFVVSFVIAVIVQDVWNTFWDLHTSDDDEEFFTINDELPLVTGCRVFDIVTNTVGIYVADVDNNAVVLTALGENKIHIYHTNLQSLIVVDDME